MRIVTLIASLAFLATTAQTLAGDLEPPGSPAPTMKTLDQVYSRVGSASGSGLQFVGTTDLVAADVGVFGMTRACQTAFGAGTRMCTSVELLSSVDLPAPTAWTSARAWVQPVIVSAYGTDTETHVLVEASGIVFEDSNPSTIACKGWSTSSVNYYGLVVQKGADYEASFLIWECDAQAGVACCGP